MATYIGPIVHLQGERALVHEGGRVRLLGMELVQPSYMAQFNNLRAFRRSYRQHQPQPRGMRKYLAYGWHRFPARHFRLDP